MLKKESTAKVFQEIIKTLEHIHNKGFLHNDLERQGDEFTPVIIDFGKSKKIAKVEGYRRRSIADYIAPEVKIGQKESPASDVYSFGKMLEAAVFSRSFCALFSKIVSETTASAPSDRPSTSRVFFELEGLRSSSKK